MKDKTQILQDCCAYFYQNGFHGASIDLVARHAHVTKRTLYSYFESKDSLILASLQYRHEQFMQRLNDILMDFCPENTAQGYLTFLQQWLLSADFFGCMFINACGEFSDKSHPIHQYAQGHKQAVLALLQQRLEQARMANAEQQAMNLFIYGEGLIVARQTGVLSDDSLRMLPQQMTI